MITEMNTRRYRQKKRAAQQEQTRDRIVEAVMKLHEDVGAARTTVSAIAERAGVQRLTVYRHFPDETSLLEACTTRWLELHPMPQEREWSPAASAEERIHLACRAFSSYYRRTQAMWRSATRDIDLVPALAERMKLVSAYLDGVARQLADSLPAQDAGNPSVFATLRHAVEFTTWKSLEHTGLSDEQIASLMTEWVDAARRLTSSARPSV
jgi:AcrR family transcriptional regulator